MRALNAIPMWQFRDGHYIWEKNAIPTWQFKDAHYILEKNAIATLWP